MNFRFFRIIGVLIVPFVFISALSFAQSGTIRGFVYEKGNGEPVIFTNVYLAGTQIGASTDVNGFYSITKIPDGDYILLVTYLGFDTLKTPVSVKAGGLITKNLNIEKSSIKLSDVVVSADREEAKTDVRVSVNKITPKDIKQIPTVGGEPDLAQYLQVLPGVIFTGDQGGQLYIRGGSPIQNKVLLDGMIIYNPFHSIGLFSVFDADIIRNADVYTGGFNAEYGGRISSVMDITTRNGNQKKFGGKVSASPFGSKLLLEGPIMKPKEEGDGTGSFIFSGKTSYLKQTSKVLYTYIDSGGLPFNFTDLYGKVSFASPSGSKLNLFGFNFRDRVQYRAVSDFNWNSAGGGANFILVPGSSPMLMQGNFSYSSYDIQLKEEARDPRSSLINGFNMGLNFTYFMGKNDIKYGVEVLGFKTDFTFFNESNRKISQEENTTEIATFVRYKLSTDKIVVEPSFRLHYYASLSTFSPEPRLGLKYNISDKIRLKYAGGLYSQNLLSANSDRDVVNLFYGFLSGPDNLPSKFNGKDVKHHLQKAIHNILGIEADLSRHLTLNVETYIKHFTQLTNINRNKLFDDTPENSDQPDELKKDFIIESGKAMGVDFLLKYEFKRFYFWTAYSIAMVNRFDGTKTYYPFFDRRHNVNLVGSYTFGKDLNWEFDARWNLGSGFPFTQTQGFYENIDFSGGMNTNYTTANGSLGIQYGTLNQGRLPYYHRLDLTIKRKVEFKKGTTLELNAGVTNVYNRENIFYFDRVKYKRVNQLPVMPSFGASLNF